MKIHIAKYADKESFRAYCGINDWTCSEEFWDNPNSLVPTSQAHKCTCKKCKVLFDKHEEAFFKTLNDIETKK